MKFFMRGAAKKLMEENNELRQAAIVELFSSIVSDTPVDEGRAQGDWQTDIKAIFEEAPKGRTKDEVLAEIMEVTKGSGLDFTLSNNVPYINRLENGYSKTQAPNGMVKKNIARMGRILRKLDK